MSMGNVSVKYLKSEIMTKILTLMLWVNFFFTYFPAHRGSILWKILPNEDAYTNLWIRFLTIFNFGFSLLLVIFQRKIKYSNILIFLILLWLFFLVSKAYNNFNGDFISIIAIPVEYFAFYIILKNYSLGNKSLNIFIILSSIWVIIPIILFFVGPIEMKLSLVSVNNGRLGTYGGFALHRNYFGFYAGLAIIISIFSHVSVWNKLFLFIFGFISIFVSTSRSAFLCLIIAIFIYAFQTYKKWRIPIFLSILFIGVIYYSLSNQVQLRTGDITSTSDREELVGAFTDSISYHPVLGKGMSTLYYSATYPNGAPAHNFILQICNDYGIMVFICFCLFWSTIYIYGNIIVRTFIIYLISFGLFQPYFMLNIPSPFVWMTILSICLVSNTNRLKPLRLNLIHHARSIKK